MATRTTKATAARRVDGKSASDGLVFWTPWGWIGVRASDGKIDSLSLPKPSRTAAWRAVGGECLGRTPCGEVVRMARRQVLEYLAGRRRRFAFPVGRLHGTAFQRKVWGVTEQIPFGEVRSYQWVAERVGGKQYARAVGMALGANRLPLAIPCHRVVRGDGSLGGFTGGPDIKKKLLALEQRRH